MLLVERAVGDLLIPREAPRRRVLGARAEAEPVEWHVRAGVQREWREQRIARAAPAPDADEEQRERGAGGERDDLAATKPRLRRATDAQHHEADRDRQRDGGERPRDAAIRDGQRGDSEVALASRPVPARDAPPSGEPGEARRDLRE